MVNPRIFWKTTRTNFLAILASLARDVLSTPAIGSGVERLFNSACDICHYRRGSLKPKDLMMLMYTTRFDIESEQLILIEEYLYTRDSYAAKGYKDAQKEKNKFDLISDSEDDPLDTSSQRPQGPSKRALGKRPRKEATPPPTNWGTFIQVDNEDDKNDEDKTPLPDNSGLFGESSIYRRTSGRVLKRTRRDEDLFVYRKP